MARVDLAAIAMVIFDADNTLRRTLAPHQPCPHRRGDWELIPGVRETLSSLDWRPRGRAFGVASNQDHVGYQLLPEHTALELLRDMTAAAIGPAAAYAYIRICPHTAEMNCACRKPEPGMLLSLCDDAGVWPADTLFVGDAETGRACAQRASVCSALLAQNDRSGAGR